MPIHPELFRSGVHYHFLLRTPEPVLSVAMQRINGQYARSFNKRHGRRGHLFGATFGSRFVQTQPDLLGVVRYIALNPLDEPSCRHPRDWPWSSYRNTVDGEPDPLAGTTAVLQLVGGARRLRALLEQGLFTASEDVSFTSSEEADAA